MQRAVSKARPRKSHWHLPIRESFRFALESYSIVLKQNNSFTRSSVALRALKCFLLAGSLFVFAASAASPAPSVDNRQDPAGEANRLAREVIEHEIQAQIRDNSLWHYRQLKEEKGKKRLFDVYQTKEGEISRLLEVNGEPLSARQEKEEAERIRRLATHPDAMREEKRKQNEDADKARSC